MDTFIQQIINGLVLGSIYALVALGYTMVYGILGLINFAHGEVVMIGALTALTVIKLLANSGLPGIVVVLLAPRGGGPGVHGARLHHRARRLPPAAERAAPAPLITAIGVSIVLQQLAMIFWGRNYHAFPPILPTTGRDIGGAHITDRCRSSSCCWRRRSWPA
jgi:branched-chain amino acid transport system permease protein